MFCSRSANSKINKLHERSLRIIYDDSNSKFEDFLTTDSSFIIHHQNIQTLEIEMFKIHQGFSQISFSEEVALTQPLALLLPPLIFGRIPKCFDTAV